MTGGGGRVKGPHTADKMEEDKRIMGDKEVDKEDKLTMDKPIK